MDSRHHNRYYSVKVFRRFGSEKLKAPVLDQMHFDELPELEEVLNRIKQHQGFKSLSTGIQAKYAVGVWDVTRKRGKPRAKRVGGKGLNVTFYVLDGQLNVAEV